MFDNNALNWIYDRSRCFDDGLAVFDARLPASMIDQLAGYFAGMPVLNSGFGQTWYTVGQWEIGAHLPAVSKRDRQFRVKLPCRIEFYNRGDK